MRPALKLYQQALRLTFFTRPQCVLCDEAKLVMSKVWDKRPFEYDEIDVMEPNRGKWKNLYEFDTPVLHIDKTKENNSAFETSAKARKLMHRFTEAELQKAMDEVESNPGSESQAPAL